mgnify:CR=1 FL=1
MKWYYILLITLISIIVLFLLVCYICYRKTFYSKNKKLINRQNLMPSNVYLEYNDVIQKDIEDVKQLTYIDLSIKSFDGLILKGKYYEKEPGYPIEIMFHGYKGSGLRDLSTGVKRAFLCNHNALIVDQRASGESEGKVITFGIKERIDCLSWINHIIEVFGPEVKVILTGISMGAATVLMASSFDLPNNVIGIISDCSYNKPSDIIKKVIGSMNLPINIFYPFILISAKIFGKFNLEETSPFIEVQKSKVPIIFFHGGNDIFVPCAMSEKLYDACNNTKKIVKINNAGHGLSYLVDPEKYLKELRDFFI